MPGSQEMAHNPQFEMSTNHHFSAEKISTHQQCSSFNQRTPVNQPLSVNVNIEYRMDASKFEELEYSQPALLIHPSFLQRVLTPTVPFWAIQMPSATYSTSYQSFLVPAGHHQMHTGSHMQGLLVVALIVQCKKRNTNV